MRLNQLTQEQVTFLEYKYTQEVSNATRDLITNLMKLQALCVAHKLPFEINACMSMVDGALDRVSMHMLSTTFKRIKQK